MDMNKQITYRYTRHRRCTRARAHVHNFVLAGAHSPLWTRHTTKSARPERGPEGSRYSWCGRYGCDKI